MCSLDTTAIKNFACRVLMIGRILALAVLLSWARPAVAEPITADMAARAVQGWLRQDRRPLGRPVSGRIKGTKTIRNAAGETLYYVVRLDPSGFVILPGDDEADPIVAFSSVGNFDESSESPLAALVGRDLPRRMARARARAATTATLKAHRKWQGFLAGSLNPPDLEEHGHIVMASQIWVAPFVQTLWNQTVDVSWTEACYNYYTPPYAPGTTNNYPCGCVATALAQELYYFQYPNTGVGAGSFNITVNGFSQAGNFRGGDGAGGPYQWTNMPLSPNGPPTNQAAAIGALTYDAGGAVNMEYEPYNSSAFTHAARQALTSTFKYANAAYYENDASGISGANLLNAINPNLDARLPVILGIEPDGGHCVLCDGYGYSSYTLFHHLNAGFGGDDDIWYSLPEVDTSDGNGDFTSVVACIYNIYTNGSGQIISGRVTDPAGLPVTGATVTAVRRLGGTYSAMTDTNGIYALARLPAASTYALTVTARGDIAATANYSTGTSMDRSLPIGNVWGANFVLSPPLTTIPETGFASIGPVGGPFSVMGQIYTLTNASGSSESWTISTPGGWLNASPTNGTVPARAASTLTVFLNPAANGLAAGTYPGSIWITNLNNGVAQELSFSLSVKAADYPMAVTGYNLDVVVENTAVGGNTANYADSFDLAYPDLSPPGPVCFYEAQLVAINLFGGSAALGLPPGGLITNETDHATTFQLGPYDGNNVLYLTPGAPEGLLAFDTPIVCKSLSILAGSAQGGGTGTLVIHFADHTTSPAIGFNAPDYLMPSALATNAALSNFGIVATGYFQEYATLDGGNVFPTLYQTSINLESLGLAASPIVSVTFTLPAGQGTTTNTVTGIFALSGAQAPSTMNYTLNVSASPANAGTVSGGGAFPAGSWQEVAATANNGFEFIGWTGDATGASSPVTAILSTNLNITANFAPASTNIALTVLTSGNGKVSPNLNGRSFKVNHNYILTATPASGAVFSNWTGSIMTSKNPLVIKAESNMVLQANFVTNPFPPVKGVYEGLFFNTTTGVTEQTAGMVRGLTVRQNGTYSGAVLINGGTHAIGGKFTAGGQSTNRIARSAQQGGPLVVAMKMNWNDLPPQITGTVMGTNGEGPWESDLTAYFVTNALPIGEYTLLIPPDTDNAPPDSSPGGEGFACITNSGLTVRITGALADGTTFNQTVPASRDGYVPLYAGLYAGRGLLMGWINLDLTNWEAASACSLTWIHPARASGLYTNGFTSVLLSDQFFLSRWTNPPVSVLATLTNLTMLDRISDTNALTIMAVTTTSAGKISGPTASGAINLKTGQWNVTIDNRATRTIGHGALSLAQSAGGGYFLTKTNAQALQLGP